MTARTLKQTDTPLLHYLRDIRVLQIIGQVIFALVLIAFFYGIAAGILGALAEKNLTPNLAFLGTRAGFDIAERPEWYSSNSTYWEAYQVGLINTLRVVAVSLVLTTVIGVFVGIFLLSTNWLVRTISQIYVEILRNTPLLVQLFIWYFIVMLSLPSFQQSLALPQEGMTLLPVRLLVYLAVLFVIRYVMPRRGASRARVDGFTVGLAAAALVFEVGFWLSHNVDSWANVYGRGNLSAPSFLAYIAVSTILIIISLFVPARWKPLVRGATIGQLIGGIFLYFGVIPNSALRFEMQPAIYLNIRGIALPEMAPTARFAEWLAFVGVGVALALAMYVYLGRVTETTGKPFPRARYGLLAIVIFAVIGWVVAGMSRFRRQCRLSRMAPSSTCRSKKHARTICSRRRTNCSTAARRLSSSCRSAPTSASRPARRLRPNTSRCCSAWRSTLRPSSPRSCAPASRQSRMGRSKRGARLGSSIPTCCGW